MVSKNEGRRNFNHRAAVAEKVAATTKSDFPAATESSMTAATSSGSAPLINMKWKSHALLRPFIATRNHFKCNMQPRSKDTHNITYRSQ
jgi:hypothetical protein